MGAWRASSSTSRGPPSSRRRRRAPHMGWQLDITTLRGDSTSSLERPIRPICFTERYSTSCRAPVTSSGPRPTTATARLPGDGRCSSGAVSRGDASTRLAHRSFPADASSGVSSRHRSVRSRSSASAFPGATHTCARVASWRTPQPHRSLRKPAARSERSRWALTAIPSAPAARPSGHSRRAPRLAPLRSCARRLAGNPRGRAASKSGGRPARRAGRAAGRCR